VGRPLAIAANPLAQLLNRFNRGEKWAKVGKVVALTTGPFILLQTDQILSSA
jgi:hypothetical protein